MSRHLAAKKSDPSQKLSRQFTTRKHSSFGDVNRHSDNYGQHKKQPLKVKDKYKTWANQIEDDFTNNDDYSAV